MRLRGVRDRGERRTDGSRVAASGILGVVSVTRSCGMLVWSVPKVWADRKLLICVRPSPVDVFVITF